MLDDVLGRTVRRFRAPAMPASLEDARATGAATALAVAIERAREALAAGDTPQEEVQSVFLAALAQLLREAMRGDPAFQAMALRHRSAVVREHASLSAHAERDRRAVRAAVNALAHPAKTQRRRPGPMRDALLALHAAATAGDWVRVSGLLGALRDDADGRHGVDMRDGVDGSDDPACHRGIERLIDEPALTRLRRLDDLASDAQVARYRELSERRGPLAGSEQAAARGAGAQQRGDAVEALAVDALDVLVERMNAQAGEARYRIAASLRVPPSFPGDAARAKSEWDVALLRRHSVGEDWDLCLLVEAKASPDAATTDLPRLLRGLRLLAQADVDTTYVFNSADGEVRLRGMSLNALPTEEGDLARAVLYCCDGADDRVPRLLNAASRMQLLSAEASLDVAALLEDGAPVDPSLLRPVWRQLLEAPPFTSVLRQYVTLRAVRELMVHPEDLAAAVQGDGDH
ncbi:3-deoxy-D-arabino-heptulosonate 7-phosphate synthase [Mitsuaria sp. CC2]